MSELLSDYIEAKAGLDKYKALESKLRIELLAELFPTEEVGTSTVEVNGLKVKGTFKLNYKLDSNDYYDNISLLSDDEMACIQLKPGLSLAKYKALPEDERVTLDECITVSPAMPTIKIEQAEE